MHCPTPTHRHQAFSRNAFTLVEILVTITIIGILVGMLAVAAGPVLRGARETAVVVEMRQIEMAIEEFKNKYGFYPPCFENDSPLPNSLGIASAADLRRYVNRISPNHAEDSPSGHGSETRLEHWYEQIGQYLDQESSLVFWLSGVCKNKQFPITGGLTGSPPIAAHNYGADDIERDVFFEFKQGQLVGDDDDEVFTANLDDGTMETIDLSHPVRGFIFEYKMAYGSQTGVTDLTYKYRDSGVYSLGAYTDGTNFLNPNGFQLITLGLSGKSNPAGNVFDRGPESLDNICNFAEGRLDKYINDNAD